jgi:peptide-methionine (R)-S-oxide reductase
MAACGTGDPPQASSDSNGDKNTENIEMANKINKSEDEWKKELDEQEYNVLREKGTERAFTGDLWDNHEKGEYICAGCGAKLFHSDHKFDSGTGWPSFFQPLSEENVETEEDRSLFSVRTEVHCKKCGGHLGHVFPDGPEPTGQRYCINSVSLDFAAKPNDESGTEEK